MRIMTLAEYRRHLRTRGLRGKTLKEFLDLHRQQRQAIRRKRP